MRLLNTREYEMWDFVSDEDKPPYAILSHRWEQDEEVTYQEWENRANVDITHKNGFRKILEFRAQAAREGFDWVWVDTCCIDKKSSAELSEAINAMFRWYREATICYVYLSDVTLSDISEPEAVEEFEASRWFTRGWTLQELIAPKQARFYTESWQEIGTKSVMCDLLSHITNIDPYILNGGDLETVSVARRMSWASQRHTSRVEDMAYCLLGIFDVNIPLIYGEGKRAFQRLQEAIMVKTHDQSLFAWGELVQAPSKITTFEQDFGLEPTRWEPPDERHQLLGLFAESPKAFAGSSEIEPCDEFSHELRRTHPPAILSGGIYLGLVTTGSTRTARHLDRIKLVCPTSLETMVLVCRIGKQDDRMVGLLLRHWGDGYHARTPELLVLKMRVDVLVFRSQVSMRHVARDPERPPPLRHGDVFFSRNFTQYGGISLNPGMTTYLSGWRLGRWAGFQLLHCEGTTGQEDFRFMFDVNDNRGVAIAFRRLPATDMPGSKYRKLGKLQAQVIPMTLRTPANESERRFNRMIPEYSFPEEQTRTRVMADPADAWAVEMDGFPGVYLRVQRMDLDEGEGGKLDVVDFFMFPGGSLADKAKRAVGRWEGIEGMDSYRDMVERMEMAELRKNTQFVGY
ncbi:heterokaryon incompatibility protein-domain-containing protein [Echria macrotheca]|uniref:Heterokaryon incompatibility protein-domain-containing protein n=1 Tax=Echria macrotheca TaxID=438768 RepID=A0AAJ0BQ99_9PEZI|nr:heterokaryon incompatibility protein-domain-containing protein [Echria macrotheca]